MLMLAVVATGVGASFFFEISDYREGPITVARGTVTNISMDATAAYDLPREMITVKLAHGPTVVATAPRGLPIQRGTLVIVDTYRYHLTRDRVYRVHRFATAPPPSPLPTPIVSHSPRPTRRGPRARATGPSPPLTSGRHFSTKPVASSMAGTPMFAPGTPPP